jgi:rubrerythrin
MELKGSKTEKNLRDAYSGESQARNKYDYFAGAARKEGFQQIAAIFEETALNEKEHAKLWLRALSGFADGTSEGDTLKNLAAAAAGEHYEWTEMYTGFAAVAKEEGFDGIAQQFLRVATVENGHEARYNKLAANLKSEAVFERAAADTRWRCRNCGYIHTGAEAPDTCAVCKHPKAYFELEQANF